MSNSANNPVELLPDLIRQGRAARPSTRPGRVDDPAILFGHVLGGLTRTTTSGDVASRSDMLRAISKEGCAEMPQPPEPFADHITKTVGDLHLGSEGGNWVTLQPTCGDLTAAQRGAGMWPMGPEVPGGLLAPNGRSEEFHSTHCVADRQAPHSADLEGLPSPCTSGSVAMAIGSRTTVTARGFPWPPKAQAGKAACSGGASMPPSASLQALGRAGRDIICSETVELPIGQYQVNKADVTGGTLRLELLTPQHPESRIRISIPLKSLVDGCMTRNAAMSARQSPMTKTVPGGALEHLLTHNKVTQLDIFPADLLPSSESSVAEELPGVADIRLALHTRRGTMALYSRVQPHVTHATVDGRAAVTETTILPAASTSLNGENGESLTGRPQAHLAQRPAPEGHGATVPRPPAANNKDVLTEKVGSGPPETGGNGTRFLAEMVAYDRGAVDTKSGELPLQRVSLPDDFPTAIRHDKNVIMLRIEPDHLGPARLTLSMHGDRLKAHVLVETLQAKAVVEASLDDLTSQLAKANIEVDYIDVQVTDRGVDQWGPGRQPRWTRYAHLDHLSSDDTTASESTQVARELAPEAPWSGGINLLA